MNNSDLFRTEFTHRGDGPKILFPEETMSPKELLYIEDALGHEKQIKATCQDSAAKLEDQALAAFVKSVADRHTACFNKFYGLVGGNYAG